MPQRGGTSNVEFALLLGSPLVGAAVLAVLGARRFAPELNVAFSLLTFLAACALTVRVIGEGSLTLAHDQFFIDPFNVFLVTLTAFVGFTTALFSRPYMRVEMQHGRVKAPQLPLSRTGNQHRSPTMVFVRTAGNR